MSGTRRVPDKHLWCCLTQNIRDSAALAWAAQQQPAVMADLKEMHNAFLIEFGRTHSQIDWAQIALIVVKQGLLEHLWAFCWRVIQDYHQLHNIAATTALNPAQEQTVVAIIHTGLHPAVASTMWNAGAESLADIQQEASESTDRALHDTTNGLDESMTSITVLEWHMTANFWALLAKEG